MGVKFEPRAGGSTFRRVPAWALATLGLIVLYAGANAAPSAGIRGTVVDADSDQPIAGAQISIPEFGLEATTNAGGEFSFSGIPMGERSRTSTITIAARGYGDWTIQDVRIVAGDTLIVDAQMGLDPILIVVPPPRAERPDWPTILEAQALGGALAESQLDLPLPPSIRVRVTGYPLCDLDREYTVEVVDFKEYVKHVLPNEWVNFWPWESLRAGAMAVKMYAWSYIAQGGKWPDADVYDSTCDQVYNPAVSYESTNQSVDYIWNWRLTRGDQLLRTFYRAYFSQCEEVGLEGNCMGQYESRDMAYDLYTWDEILLEFYDNAVLSPVWDPPGGFSLRFFGNGYADIDRVKIPIDPHIPADVGAEDFTLEWWMKAIPGENSAGACTPGGDNWIFGNMIFDRDVFGDGDHGDYGVSLADGRIAFGIGRGSESHTVCGETDLADGAWHHVAVTRALDEQMQIYVDGKLDGAGSGPAGDISYRDGRSTSYPDDPYLVIGAEKHDLDRVLYPSFSGWLNEIRLSNVVRYAAEFARPEDPFLPDENTVALYHLDEGVGNVINDTSGAAGGPSHGLRKYGGVTNGPEWTDDTLWYVPPPTPTPTNTPTSTDTPTPTMTHTASATPTVDGTVTETPSPTATPTASDTPTLEPSPTPTMEPTHTDTPVPPSPTPLPTDTSIPPSATPSPTNTPIPPSATPLPTNTPIPASATPLTTNTPLPPSATPKPTNTPLPSGTPQPATATPTATSSSTPQPTESPDTPTPTITPVPGDINQDGRVDVLDVQLCVNVFLGMETDPELVSRADANGDGEVNVLDVQLIANIFLSG